MRAQVRKLENGHFVTIYEVTKEKDGEAVSIPYIKAEKPSARSNYNGPMREAHKERFPQSYQAWETGEEGDAGTPIDRLPGIPENIVVEYTSRDIYTIEDLASLDDMDVQRFPLGRKYADEAKRYLDFSNPETRKREAEEMKESMKSELLSEIMGNPEALKSIADEMGLAVRKKRATKED